MQNSTQFCISLLPLVFLVSKSIVYYMMGFERHRFGMDSHITGYSIMTATLNVKNPNFSPYTVPALAIVSALLIATAVAYGFGELKEEFSERIIEKMGKAESICFFIGLSTLIFGIAWDILIFFR